MVTRTDRNQTFDTDGNLIAEEMVEVDVTEETNESTVRQRADVALADLRTIANSTGTLSGAQLSNAVRVLARVAIAVIRLSLRRFDAVD